MGRHLLNQLVYVELGIDLRRGNLTKHPFLLALRRWGRFARNVLRGEERGETDVFAGYRRRDLLSFRLCS